MIAANNVQWSRHPQLPLPLLPFSNHFTRQKSMSAFIWSAQWHTTPTTVLCTVALLIQLKCTVDPLHNLTVRQLWTYIRWFQPSLCSFVYTYSTPALPSNWAAEEPMPVAGGFEWFDRTPLQPGPRRRIRAQVSSLTQSQKYDLLFSHAWVPSVYCI